MRAVVLNGADEYSTAVDDLCAEVEHQLDAARYAVRTFHLRGFSIGHCLGEFDCWVKTPSRCRIHDEGEEIERAVHDADLLVLVSPVSFGAYGSQAKKAIDRLLPLVTPFFEKRADLTHHEPRYARLPRLVGIGLDATPSASRRALFSWVVESNALNLGCSAWSAASVGCATETWKSTVASALAQGTTPGNASGDLPGAQRMLRETMAATSTLLPATEQPRVVILLGSARAPGTSTSESLARHLQEQMHLQGTGAKIVHATEFVRTPANAARAAALLAAANVLIVCAPIYMDSLPYLCVLALEKLREARRDLAQRHPARLVGMLNCGFPEPEHMRFAVAQLREFATEAEYAWAGAMPVGGGEAIHGRPLGTLGGMTRRLRHALEASAAALAAGKAVPDHAGRAAATSFLPPTLYRLAGWWG